MRRIVFAILWILSLAGISFYGGAVSYGFFFALTLIPPISCLYLGFVYWRFRIYQEVESRNVVCGQPTAYFFVLPNDDFFAFASVRVEFFSTFSTVEKLSEHPEYELLPGERYTYETKLTCKYRGEYEVGVKEVVITDFLRLFAVHYHIPTPIKAVVLPKVVEVSELCSIQEMNIFLQREAYGTNTEPDSVVRDYIPGDALKQIHWRATAKAGSLKVRGWIGEDKQGIAIYFDTKRYSEDMQVYLPSENKLLEVVLALGMFLAKRTIDFCVYDGQGMEQRVSGMQDFEQFYQGTAQLVFGKEQALWQTVQEAFAAGRFFSHRLIFFVVQKVDGEIMQITEELTKSGHMVVMYVVGDKVPGEILHQSNERRKIVWLSPEAELEGGL